MLPAHKKQKALFDALLKSFPTLSELQQLLKFELDQNLAEISLGSNLQEVVFRIIQWAESHGKLRDLYLAALDQRPHNPELQELFIDIGLGSESFSYDSSLQLTSLMSPSITQVTYDNERINDWEERYVVYKCLLTNFGTPSKFKDLCHLYNWSPPVTDKTTKDKIFTMVAQAEKDGRLSDLKKLADRLSRDTRSLVKKRERANQISAEAKHRQQLVAQQYPLIRQEYRKPPPPSYRARDDWFYWVRLAYLSIFSPKDIIRELSNRRSGDSKRIATVGLAFICVLFIVLYTSNLVGFYFALDNAKYIVSNDRLQWYHTYIPIIGALILTVPPTLAVVAIAFDIEMLAGLILIILTLVSSLSGVAAAHLLGLINVLFTLLGITALTVVSFAIATNTRIIYGGSSNRYKSRITPFSALPIFSSIPIAFVAFISVATNIGASGSSDFYGVFVGLLVASIMFVINTASVSLSIQQAIEHNRSGSRPFIVLFGLLFCIFCVLVTFLT